ncbi:hypothetical protein AVEN_239634-1 [Araneus ventricosus]|uniref:Uncharacterized protein n=1 Tax=Araneus ventricosus TaxID=182803 RepID=A0A4Y2TPU0_ARAVE|nr:hypothetical protein AVEN_239634-1 [Araneus ventricosus]
MKNKGEKGNFSGRPNRLLLYKYCIHGLIFYVLNNEVLSLKSNGSSSVYYIIAPPSNLHPFAGWPVGSPFLFLLLFASSVSALLLKQRSQQPRKDYQRSSWFTVETCHSASGKLTGIPRPG